MKRVRDDTDRNNNNNNNNNEEYPRCISPTPKNNHHESVIMYSNPIVSILKNI